MIDAGTNGARNLGRFAVDQGRVEAVFLTHAHSDHIDGLGELGMLRWVSAGSDRPLAVYGPPVVGDVVAGFNQAYAADFGYRRRPPRIGLSCRQSEAGWKPTHSHCPTTVNCL